MFWFFLKTTTRKALMFELESYSAHQMFALGQLRTNDGLFQNTALGYGPSSVSVYLIIKKLKKMTNKVTGNTWAYLCRMTALNLIIVIVGHVHLQCVGKMGNDEFVETMWKCLWRIPKETQNPLKNTKMCHYLRFNQMFVLYIGVIPAGCTSDPKVKRLMTIETRNTIEAVKRTDVKQLGRVKYLWNEMDYMTLNFAPALRIRSINNAMIKSPLICIASCCMIFVGS